MGDDKDAKGAADAKPPASIDGLPQDIADFLDCKSDKVELKPGKQAWLGGIDLVGDTLAGANITFDTAKDGSVSVKAQLGEGALSVSQTVKMKVDADGQLSIDASDSMLLSGFKDKIDDWTKVLNNWFRSKGKKLGKPTVKAGSGKLTLSKEKVVAAATPKATTPKEGVKGGLLPLVPTGEKVAAGALFAIATVGAFFGLPSDTTSVRTVTEVVASPGPVVTPPPGNNVVAPTKPVIGASCIRLMHVPGQYSFEIFDFTTYPQFAGTWTVNIAQGPAGPESGSGKVDSSGRGEVEIKIFNLGMRDGFSIMGPGGVRVDPGSFAQFFPWNITSAPLSCDPLALHVPTPPIAQPSQPASGGQGQSGAGTEVQTKQVTTTEHGGPPWSLLLIPGSAAMFGGGLFLDEQRRRKAAATADPDLIGRIRFNPEMPDPTPAFPLVLPPPRPPEVQVDTDVEKPTLPPADDLRTPPPPNVDPDTLM